MARKRNLYEPGAEKSFRLSRSKVDDFLGCRRCFYVDRRLGISHPPGFPFNLTYIDPSDLDQMADRYRP